MLVLHHFDRHLVGQPAEKESMAANVGALTAPFLSINSVNST